MYSNVYYEQVLRVREEPTKGGARACDAGVMSQCHRCIWLKSYLIKHLKGLW